MGACYHLYICIITVSYSVQSRMANANNHTLQIQDQSQKKCEHLPLTLDEASSSSETRQL